MRTHSDIEPSGTPRWDGNDGRLELTYDEAADTIRVHHLLMTGCRRILKGILVTPFMHSKTVPLGCRRWTGAHLVSGGIPSTWGSKPEKEHTAFPMNSLKQGPRQTEGTHRVSDKTAISTVKRHELTRPTHRISGEIISPLFR